MGGTPLICGGNPSHLTKLPYPSLFSTFFPSFFWTGFSLKRPPIFMTFETENATLFFKTFHGNKPCEKKPTCVSTRKNAYEKHVGLPMNDHEFMTKRSKALTEPLLKTSSFLKTIFHYFWSILGSKTERVFLIGLTFSAQGRPRPSKTPQDPSRDSPPGAPRTPKSSPRPPQKVPQAPQGRQKGVKSVQDSIQTHQTSSKTLPGSPRCLEKNTWAHSAVNTTL